MITFFKFTSTGGRFGRIQWVNSDDNFWGCCGWDQYWPLQKPQPRLYFAAISASVDKLCVAFNDLGAAFGRLSSSVSAMTETLKQTQSEP